MAQKSFSVLWSGYASNEAAKAARDEEYRRLKKIPGANPRRWVLKNQLKQYESFGVPDGRICDCYFINFDDRAT